MTKLPTSEYRNISWQKDAACRNLPYERSMRMFFPEKGQSWREARILCQGGPDSPRCPVLNECLSYALSFEPEGIHGIWGGTSHAERRVIYDEMKAADIVKE